MFFKKLFGACKRLIFGRVKLAIKDGMTVGKNFSHMGGGSFGSEPYLITIGNNVRFSYQVCLITHDGGTWAFRHEEQYKDVNSFGKIVIDDGTFVGARATIMPGVHIGKNCVIGAGAVVTKSIPDYSVAVGVPAKVIGDTRDYAEKMKNRMPENWDVSEYKRNKKEYLIKTIPTPEKPDKD